MLATTRRLLRGARSGRGRRLGHAGRRSEIRRRAGAFEAELHGKGVAIQKAATIEAAEGTAEIATLPAFVSAGAGSSAICSPSRPARCRHGSCLARLDAKVAMDAATGSRRSLSRKRRSTSPVPLPGDNDLRGAIAGAGRRGGLRAFAARQDGRRGQKPHQADGHQPGPCAADHRQSKGARFRRFRRGPAVKDLQNAVKEGYREIELVKRFTTVGMGPSQGRHSALATARIVAEATNRTVGEVGVTTARPPVGPETLGVLAGHQEPLERRTALHARHLALNAVMKPVAPGGGRISMAMPVRRKSDPRRDHGGARRRRLLDVSTLGKLELRGRMPARSSTASTPWRMPTSRSGASAIA